jgi:hypothetical protein
MDHSPTHPTTSSDLVDVPLGCALDGVRVGYEFRLLTGAQLPGTQARGFDTLDAARLAIQLAGVGTTAIFEVDGRFIACGIDAEWRDPADQRLRRAPLDDARTTGSGRVAMHVRRNTPEARMLCAIVDGVDVTLLPRSA